MAGLLQLKKSYYSTPILSTFQAPTEGRSKYIQLAQAHGKVIALNMKLKI